MSRLYIHQVHIADGFVDDCDELIQRCSQIGVLTYHTFCDIWKSMNFASMYEGRSSHAEIAEMSEEVLLIAKHYLVANTSNFEESVAGLFLVYALVNLQPYVGFAPLRIIPEDVPSINRIEMVARRERRYDVLYVLASLLIQGPTQYHAAQRERGMEPAFKKYLNGYACIDARGIRPKGVFYRQNKELDVIRELNGLSKRYTEAKQQIAGTSSSDRSLNYMDENLASELESSLKLIITGFLPNTEPTTTPQTSSETRSDLVQSIKQRAMTNTADQIKHLTGINERKKAKTSPKKNKELKPKGGKCKNGSPSSSTRSPRKRKITNKNVPDTKTNKRKSAQNGKDLQTDINEKSKEEDLNLDDFINKTNSDTLNITVQSVPILIQTQDDGELIEIQIVEDQNNINDVRDLENLPEIADATNNMSKTIQQNKSTPKVTRAKCVAREDNENEKTPEQICKPKKRGLSELLEKKELRDLKRPILKRKLKKLGLMIEVSHT